MTSKKAQKSAKKSSKKASKPKVKPEQVLETPIWSGRERFQAMKDKKVKR